MLTAPPHTLELIPPKTHSWSRLCTHKHNHRRTSSQKVNLPIKPCQRNVLGRQSALWPLLDELSSHFISDCMASQQELQNEYGKDFLRFPSSRMLFMTRKWQGLSAPPPNLHHLSLCHLKASQNITKRNDNQSSKDVVCRAAVIKKHKPRGGKKLLNSWEMTHFLISPADSLSTGITLHFSMIRESEEWSCTGWRGAGGSAITMVMQAYHSHLSSLGLPCLDRTQQDFFLPPPQQIVIQSLYRSKRNFSLYSSADVMPWTAFILHEVHGN